MKFLYRSRDIHELSEHFASIRKKNLSKSQVVNAHPHYFPLLKVLFAFFLLTIGIASTVIFFLTLITIKYSLSLGWRETEIWLLLASAIFAACLLRLVLVITSVYFPTFNSYALLSEVKQSNPLYFALQNESFEIELEKQTGEASPLPLKIINHIEEFTQKHSYLFIPIAFAFGLLVAVLAIIA